MSTSIVIIALISGVACSPQQRTAIAGPSGVAGPSEVATRAPVNFSVSAAKAVSFPPRNEPFLFRTNLESKYRDDLRRGATTSFVDIEGTVVWTQEYIRYRLNQCGHADAVARVLRQIDGFGADPVCGPIATTAFPPRNEPLDFRAQLDQKYRDLRRGSIVTFVDAEGDIVWTLEYLRYRLSSCGHLAAESKVFAQIDERSLLPPPECTACAGVPGVPSVGWATGGFPAGTVQFMWFPVGGTVTSHVVELGTTRGASNVAIVEVSGSATSHTFFGLAAGDYWARVRARNDCGTGAVSNEANPRVR